MTPDVGLTEKKRESALLKSVEYLTVCPSGSVADTVMPMVLPTGWFSVMLVE